MAKRKIIKIDQGKCNGCGQCIPNCPEGAIQIIDAKARLISDLFCDGLGACIGHCPEGAIIIEEREAESYDEKRVMENIIKQGKNVIKAHLKHLQEHKQHQYLQQALAVLKERGLAVPDGFSVAALVKHGHEHSGCPSAKVIDLGQRPESAVSAGNVPKGISQLRNWPVQIKLIPPNATYLKEAHLLFAADCVPFAYADFHRQLLKDRVLLVGCPKLDDAEFYKEKVVQILKENSIKSISCAHMEVPCCFGLIELVKQALERSGKSIPLQEITISIKGEIE